ncbi:hypothetical protein Hanom_Chr14g01286831 [Helianthus anomalus]
MAPAITLAHFAVRCGLYLEDEIATDLYTQVSTISSSIPARGKSKEWCMGGDLLFFYCLLYKRSCTLAHGLAQYFTSTHHQQGFRQLYDNTYVNVIAQSFGYHPSGDLHCNTPKMHDKLFID